MIDLAHGERLLFCPLGWAQPTGMGVLFSSITVGSADGPCRLLSLIAIDLADLVGFIISAYRCSTGW